MTRRGGTQATAGDHSLNRVRIRQGSSGRATTRLVVDDSTYSTEGEATKNAAGKQPHKSVAVAGTESLDYPQNTERLSSRKLAPQPSFLKRYHSRGFEYKRPQKLNVALLLLSVETI